MSKIPKTRIGKFDTLPSEKPEIELIEPTPENEGLESDKVRFLKMYVSSLEAEKDRIKKTNTVELGDSMFHEALLMANIIACIDSTIEEYETAIENEA